MAGSHMWCSKQRDTWASIGPTFPNGKMHAKSRTSSATIVPLLWRLDMGSANLLLCLQSGPGRSSQRPTHTYFRLSAPAPANHTKNAFAQHYSKVGCLSASERCKVRRCHNLNGMAPKRINSLRWHIATLGSEKLQRTGSDCESTIAYTGLQACHSIGCHEHPRLQTIGAAPKKVMFSCLTTHTVSPRAVVDASDTHAELSAAFQVLQCSVA